MYCHVLSVLLTGQRKKKKKKKNTINYFIFYFIFLSRRSVASLGICSVQRAAEKQRIQLAVPQPVPTRQ